MTAALALDHLVVAARDLDAGVDWCERMFGLRPTAGGRHDTMGTHNRVFSIASAAFERSYLEVIAIDPAPPAPPHARWFGLDEPDLNGALEAGPALVHWVARADDLDAARRAMQAAGIDPGEPRAASRGALAWRIAVRADGARPLRGAAPALIAWNGAHPSDTLPASGVSLAALRVTGWPDELAAWLPASIERRHPAPPAAPQAAPLEAVLDGPRGRVVLRSI